ncbi:MAG: response regulator [Chloroflexota bacterium]
MVSEKIKVTIVDDHQGIIDGYMFRLQGHPQVEVAAACMYGDEIEPGLKTHPTDVLILDLNLPTSRSDPTPYPTLRVIPELLQRYPQLVILVISMRKERSLVRNALEAGATGYILKDDSNAILELGNIIVSIARGGIYMSAEVNQALLRGGEANEVKLSPRQLEALSLSAAYPNSTTWDIALKMEVKHATVRNLLSGAYLKLEVNNRAAAIEKGRALGLLPFDLPPLSPPTAPSKKKYPQAG